MTVATMWRFEYVVAGFPMTNDNDESWVNRILDGRYKVERVLGRGGMGLVLAVEDRELRERFALKVIAGDRAGRTTPERRFLREAKVGQRIRSPHVMEVYRVGQLVTGEPYILMEYLEGKDLGDMLARRGSFPFLEAVQYIIEACAGLALAHGFGIVHRDIKPSNLFLAQRPNQPAVIKIIDFGISKYLEGEQDLTRTNVLLGSPLYMSPEQISAAKQVDARSDLFSLGVVFYQLITGVAPFAAENVNGVGQRILHATPVAPTQIRPELPWQIDGIIAKCLAKPPEERFQNAAEFSRALEALRPPAAAILEQYLDDAEENEPDPLRLETLTHSFTSSTGANTNEPGTSIFNRARAIAARGYAGPPLVASPRPIERPQPRGPTFEPSTVIPFGVPIPENPYFIRRDPALAALYDDLCKQEVERNKDNYHHPEKVVAIEATVMGSVGTGKTEFMAAYARRYREAYPGGVLWFEGTEDIEQQIAKQLGGWKPERNRMDESVPAFLLTLLERQRALIVVDAASHSSRHPGSLTSGMPLDWELPRAMMTGGRLLATHHIVYISRTEARSWYGKHVLGPIDDVNAITGMLLSIGKLTVRSCEPTLWRTARSIARALRGSPTLLQIAVALFSSDAGAPFESELQKLARRLSRSHDRTTSDTRGFVVLLESVSDHLSTPAKSLLRTLAAFAGKFHSYDTVGLLAKVPVATIAEAMKELGRYKLVELRSSNQAAIATGIAEGAARAFGVDATFRRGCLGRLADEFSNMAALYRAIELHSSKTVVAELGHFIRTSPTCAPVFLEELIRALEMAEPHLMRKPEAHAHRHPRSAVAETPAQLVAYSIFLAQLRDAAMELDCKTILERTETALRERGEMWLARRTYHRQASPRVLGIHDGAVTAVALSADGKRAVSGAEDGSLFLYDVETRSILVEHRGSAPIRCLAISADGTVAVFAAEGGAPEVWNVDRRNRMGILEGHSGNVYAVAVSPNGQRVLTAAEDGLVCAWDVDGCRPLRSLCPYPENDIWTMFVAAVSFASDGLAIVASPRGTIWYFDVDTGAVVRTIEVPEPPFGIGHTPAGPLVYARKSLEALRFRDANTGALVGDVELWTPDYVAMEKRQGGIVHASVARTKSTAEMACVATGGNSCFVASKDAMGRAYSLETGELLRELIRPWVGPGIPPHNMYGVTGHTGRVTAIASSLDGQTVVTGGADDMVMAWDVARGPVPRYDEEIVGIAVTSDGKMAISVGGTDHMLVVWDVATAQPIRSTQFPSNYFSHIVIAGNSAYVFADQKVYVWDFVQGTPLRALEMPSGNGTATVECVSSDGRRAVLREGNQSPSTRLFWDIAGARVVPFNAEQVYWAVFLNSDHVLLRYGDEQYAIVDFVTAAVVEHIHGVLQGNGPPVAISNNNRVWWTTQNGFSLVDLERKSILKTLPIPAIPGIPGRDDRIAVTPDGRTAVTVKDTLRAWSVESERVIAEIKPPFGCGRSVAMTPDGRTIIFAGIHSGKIEKYPVPPPTAVGAIQYSHIHQRHIHFMDVKQPEVRCVNSGDASSAETAVPTSQS